MWARRFLLALTIALTTVAASANEQSRTIRDLPPSSVFDDLWVVDRNTPELHQVLAEITRHAGFDAIVITGSEGLRTDVVNHLLEIAPDGDAHWVSNQPVPVGLLVDRISAPTDLLINQLPGPVVYSADQDLLDLATLVAMRTRSRLVYEAPTVETTGDIQIGGDRSGSFCRAGDGCTHLSSAADTLEFANRLATRRAVMVFAEGTLLPEHVLHAFQRGLLLLEVEPPYFSGDDPQSEVDATLATAEEIRRAVAVMPELNGGLPEALVIAGDWTQIPYRFARSTGEGWIDCDNCENGVRTYASDAEYGNLDADPWGEPEVATGRFTSYDRDLLAIQTVIGVWRDQGAFEPAPRATFLGVYAHGLREQIFETWRQGLWDRQWVQLGSQSAEENGVFEFDVEDFFFHVDDSDVVLFDGHGNPNGLFDSRRLLDGETLAGNVASARPAFWFITACATARHLTATTGWASPDGNHNLVSGLQARLAYGGLLTVEVISSGSGSLFWPGASLEPGLPVGEIVRRGQVAAISAYRGDLESLEIPPGLPRRYGNDVDVQNAWVANFWVGDPLTVF